VLGKPQQVFDNSRAYHNACMGTIFASNFGIQVGKARFEEWKDVQGPVDPSSQTLKLAQCLLGSPSRNSAEVFDVSQKWGCGLSKLESCTVSHRDTS